MSTTTARPPRVLTEEQNDELWKLFCSYGRIRWEQEAAFGARNLDESSRLRREGDEVQKQFGALLHSLTKDPS